MSCLLSRLVKENSKIGSDQIFGPPISNSPGYVTEQAVVEEHGKHMSDYGVSPARTEVDVYQ
jgi:hypothetical protein